MLSQQVRNVTKDNDHRPCRAAGGLAGVVSLTVSLYSIHLLTISGFHRFGCVNDDWWVSNRLVKECRCTHAHACELTALPLILGISVAVSSSYYFKTLAKMDSSSCSADIYIVSNFVRTRRIYSAIGICARHAKVKESYVHLVFWNLLPTHP